MKSASPDRPLPDNIERRRLRFIGDMFVQLLGGHDFEFQIWSVVDGDFPASASTPTAG